MTAVRRTSVEKFLTPKLKDRLRTEMADPKKRKERDAGSSLLAANLGKVIREECKTNSRLDQVSSLPGKTRSFLLLRRLLMRTLRWCAGTAGRRRRRRRGGGRVTGRRAAARPRGPRPPG